MLSVYPLRSESISIACLRSCSLSARLMRLNTWRR